MEILLFTELSFLVVFLVILCVNVLFGPHMRKIGVPAEQPSVAVLIPARNEEHNISACLQAFLEQDYLNIKIYVLDDQSEDKTAHIVSTFAERHSQIRLLPGKPLPDGWLGKNWACQQLSEVATDDILLFADADTQPHQSAVTKTVAWISKYNLGMFSVFPQQITERFSEKLLVPLIDFILYTLLPLWTVYSMSSPAFAAANGQWIAFRREMYSKIGGHKSVRNEVVEDVEFSRLVKKQKIKTLTASGTGIVYTRMYSSFNDIWQGLTKNFFGLTGNQAIVLGLILAVMIFAYILPYVQLLLVYELFVPVLLVFLIVSIRLILALSFRHDVGVATLLHPLMIFFGIFIALNSFYKTKTGNLSWKGRLLNRSAG